MDRNMVDGEPVGTLGIRAHAFDDGALFVGIGSAADVDRWLTGVTYEQVDSVGFGPWPTRKHLVSGTGLTPPAEQPTWVASVTGPGTETLSWPAKPGNWVIVLMNADGRTGVAADVSAGVKTDALLPIGLTLGGFGLLLLAGGVAIMLVALAGTAAGTVDPPPAPPGTYPARLDGRLEPMSRGLWLVKWLLIIPHVFVLVLLWLAVVPLTIIAGFAILVTGRYPRSIFEFNVGVMRWNWRVSFYAFGAFGTDRYPPFSLRPDPTYPADFTVDYPHRLSRGLVLVKWWLLAIPHYLVVALFTGGWTVGLGGGSGHGPFGLSLILILVLVAAVVLLFSGRYPQPVFDFVMGMNRWSYRALAYAALLRDEYPPFQLDNGGTDPGSQPVPAPPA
jgi:uncharacterized protein DUF4389